MRATKAVFKRELRSYFATPVAYVFIVIFLVLSAALTFYMGEFYERGQADLLPFFGFHPWLYLFLVLFPDPNQYGWDIKIPEFQTALIQSMANDWVT